MASVVLSGLQGDTPLGFLAALGALYLLERHEARLAWTEEEVPLGVLTSPEGGLDRDAVVDVLARSVAEAPKHLPVWSDPTLSPRAPARVDLPTYRSLARNVEWDLTVSPSADASWLAALASDLQADREAVTSKLFNLSAQETLKKVVEQLHARLVDGGREATVQKMAQALVGPWRYVDGVNSLGFDAAGSREAALDDVTGGVPGLVWLALHALPCLPTFGKSTAGVHKVGPGLMLIWPVWHHPLGVEGVRTLMSARELPEAVTSTSSDDPTLRRWGVSRVIGSRRVPRGAGKGYWKYDRPAETAMKRL